MVRRGHSVTIYYVDLPPARPPIWRIRTFIKYWINRLRTIGNNSHHLESSTASLMPIAHEPILSSDVEHANFVIATWWETAHWIKDWPGSKGKKAYFIRHHELHGGDPELVRQTYRLPYKKFVIASWLQKLMDQEYGDSNAVLVPNGVDWNQFNYVPRNKNPQPAVGVLYGKVAWKGVSTAFNAIRLVQEKIPGLRVICFGAHQIDKSASVPANLQFYFKPDQDLIPDLYRSTDCWIVPSTSEGFGMPGLEAAACGCPIVSTRCGGPEDYVDEGVNGYLVDVGDENAMAEQLIRVLQLDDDEWSTMSENSAQMAKRFDWDKSAEILENAMLGEPDLRG